MQNNSYENPEGTERKKQTWCQIQNQLFKQLL